MCGGFQREHPLLQHLEKNNFKLYSSHLQENYLVFAVLQPQPHGNLESGEQKDALNLFLIKSE